MSSEVVSLVCAVEAAGLSKEQMRAGKEMRLDQVATSKAEAAACQSGVGAGPKKSEIPSEKRLKGGDTDSKSDGERRDGGGGGQGAGGRGGEGGSCRGPGR